MLFTSMILLAASLVSASPVARQLAPVCSPNFEGVAVSVTNSAREWGITSASVGADVISPTSDLQTSNFRFEQRGQPSVSYTIKTISNNDLVVAVRPDATLELASIDSSDIAQEWNVLCDNCSTDISLIKGAPVSFGCNITSVATGYCVQIGAQKEDAMFLAPCNGKDSQNFDFWTAPA
ncbi:hypothetical protein BDZ89DRAFT_1157236 [Hymenopellis radicata]|nr:hypothetical protein BDZ89DRAFT_1157236 [Hymenopellis radicata]